jgi:murein DD-endopeptidase MepM/ murein hydrolase activator NlpD
VGGITAHTGHKGHFIINRRAAMKFIYPIPANSIVTQTFAEHVHRARINGWQNYNGGIDWAVPSGTSVKAAQAGKVTVARTDATGYGTHVRIQHDEGYLTIYGHMMKFKVKVGDEIQAGDVIGQSDNTGFSTGPHLHFELRKNSVAVDPAPLLVEHLDDEPGGEGEPGGGLVQPDIGPEPAGFPALPKARITSQIGLNIRSGPGVANPLVGWLPNETEVEVLHKVNQADDIWLQIGYQQFIAMRVGSEKLAEWKA